MKSTGLRTLLSLLSLLVAGCGSDAEKKADKTARGIEHQDCLYRGASYSQGALLCQEKTGMKCDSGMWREWSAGQEHCSAPHEKAASK